MRITQQKPHRILIVKFNAIGDVIMTTPAIRDLREAYPSSHITMLVGSWSAPAVRDNPHLDEVLEFDQQIFVERRWPAVLRLLLRIRRGHFDVAVIFHALPLIHLFIRLAGIPRRYGLVRGKARFLTAWVPENMEPDRYYAENYQEVAALAGARTGPPRTEVYTQPSDEALARQALTDAGLNAHEDYLLVAPGGARNPLEDMSARRWPPQKFTDLILDLLKDRPALRIVLSGSESDRRETGFIAARIPGAVDLTGKVSLANLFSVARGARAILCNDSSMLHIGVACEVPVVAVFGPTSAKQRLPAWALPYVRSATIPCSPCYSGGGGAFPGCDIGFRCMQETGIAEMRPLLDAALARRPA